MSRKETDIDDRTTAVPPETVLHSRIPNSREGLLLENGMALIDHDACVCPNCGEPPAVYTGDHGGTCRCPHCHGHEAYLLACRGCGFKTENPTQLDAEDQEDDLEDTYVYALEDWETACEAVVSERWRKWEALSHPATPIQTPTGTH